MELVPLRRVRVAVRRRSLAMSLVAMSWMVSACGHTGNQTTPAAGDAGGNGAAASTLPRPDAPFQGVIGETYKASKPDKIPIVKAPDGAPNVLLILIDDAGFGQWSTFGGQIPTPNLDRLAKNGLRYTRFHTTALCSPTRAALLTGRNHHSVGMGVITELADAYPGYSGQMPKSAAMVSEILR